ncbi:MAG: pyridoxamine 5'-phosphate oxidase family protein [Brotaphodocola sp.]
MRRKDREITDQAKIQDIMDRCSCCRIGFYDNGQVYIVPLNFGYTKQEDHYVFYFHGAHEGRKIDLIARSPQVGFEMDTNYKRKEAELACEYSAQFQSVIGNGTVQIVEDSEEKREGLRLLMEHNTGKHDWQFDEHMLRAVTVFKLQVTSLSCKEHR